MNRRYDAIVVGGGPSGATAAALLARAGWRVAVIEKASFPRRKVCGEFVSAATWEALQRLGVAESLRERAGPPVHRIGIYAGEAAAIADLDSQPEHTEGGGRALGREHLEAMLLGSAAAAGAEVLQPCVLSVFVEYDGCYQCTVIDKNTHESCELHSRVMIAAHGSWESGPMPTQDMRTPPNASDLFAFKADLRDSALAPDLMPLFAVPGGYGSMVHAGAGRVSLSFCLRRDTLEQCRQQWPHALAGAAGLEYIASSCRGVGLALSAGSVDGAWLASGRLRTGIRTFGREGIFPVGNAAAEAHPIVSGGIAMAVQSSALLCELLVGLRRSHGDMNRSRQALDGIRQHYAMAWRKCYSRHMHLAALSAHLFMHPVAARLGSSVMALFPKLLTVGARWSSRAETLRTARPLDAAPSSSFASRARTHAARQPGHPR